MRSKYSLTEGSIPRALLPDAQAEAIWWSFPLASLTSLAMALGYYRFGGWRDIRLGIAEAAPTPTTS